MIKLHYEEQPVTVFETAPYIEFDAVLRGESLDVALDGIERFLRAVYGWIPVDEHLAFVTEEE